MLNPISPRIFFLLLIAFLNAPLWPAPAARADGSRASLPQRDGSRASLPQPDESRGPLPQRMVIANGVVIARGNELRPPFTLAIEDDSLCIYDGTGRRFANDAAMESAAPALGSGLPVPRLLAAAARGGVTSPAVRMAQLAHLLRAGGALAFGDSYLVAFPPASAAEVLPDLRWIAEHAVHLSGELPPTNPFFRDLMWPARLAPAAPGPS